MKYPKLPRFNIPPSCEKPLSKLTPEEYEEWVSENIKDLREKGLYDKLCRDPLRTPVDARFRIKED